MPKIKLNGRVLEVEAGKTILQVASENGIEIPHYCYHPKLSVAGNCRMCLVEVQGMPKLATACSTPIMNSPPARKIDGEFDMVINSKSEEAAAAQKSVMEFLLLNHPTDCPVCDKAGECRLQDYSYGYGRGYRRAVEEKTPKPKKDLGPNIALYTQRCILCSRCVRFCDEIVGSHELAIANRGCHDEIVTYPGKPLENRLSGNVADICPVGALVTKDFLFSARVWNLKKTSSVCSGCSAGCNIQIETMAEKIKRIQPKNNENVNSYWICDDGRFGYNEIQDAKRIKYPRKKDQSGNLSQTDLKTAIAEVVEKVNSLKKIYKPKAIGFLGSAHASNEENFLLNKLARKIVGSSNVGLRAAEITNDEVVFKSGFKIYGDKTPNRFGAKVILGSENAQEIYEKIKNGEIKALFLLGGIPETGFLPHEEEIFSKLELLVVVDYLDSDLTQSADFSLGGKNYFEKQGTFTNVQERVQKFNQAVSSQGSFVSDVEILQELMVAFDKSWKEIAVSEIFNQLAKENEFFRGMTFYKLGQEGMLKQ
ncbi:molybdopterin-dependent oxidoreductase [bacterium]|nr:molybdopterin-dependent oxidoreductase [bacterium]